MTNIAQNLSPPYLPTIVVKSSRSLPSEASQGNSESHPKSSFTDKVSLSKEGRQLSSQEIPDSSNSQKVEAPPGAEDRNLEITSEELREIQRLQKRDTEVKNHENAHKATAGHHASGGPSYTYDVGPNGKMYAVGGEVPIDMSKEATPEATLQKMQIVTRAALAPANPSAADRKIAARATMLAAQSRRELQIDATNETHKMNESSGAESDAIKEPSKAPQPSEVSSQSLSPNVTVSRQMVLRAYQHQPS